MQLVARMTGYGHRPGLARMPVVAVASSLAHQLPAIALDEPDGLYLRLDWLRPSVQVILDAPGRTRTCDPRIRSPTLYPAELRGLVAARP